MELAGVFKTNTLEWRIFDNMRSPKPSIYICRAFSAILLPKELVQQKIEMLCCCLTDLFISIKAHKVF